MTTQQIINKFVTLDSPEHLASNILMGIYLGMEYVDDDPEFSINGYFTDNSNEDLSWIYSDLPENWKFHDNWNWLIPIVQKLQKEPAAIQALFITHYIHLLGSLNDLNYEMIYNDAAECIKIILKDKQF
jgi:hypothetical protein